MASEKIDKRLSRGQATRQHLIEVATRLFAENGYEATSIEAILTACEISRGALYHHFENKEELFEAVFEAVEQQATARSTAALLSEPDAVLRLRRGCKAFLMAAQDQSFRQIALLDAPLAIGWERWRELENQYGLGVLKAGLSAALKACKKNARAVDETAHLLLAALIEASLLIARAEERHEVTEACAIVIDSLIDGIIGK